VQHNGDYPAAGVQATDGTADWDALTSATDIAGTLAGDDDYGPYLQKAPVNPFTNGSTVAADNSEDWQYNATTGQILAVFPGTATERDDLGLTTSDVVLE